VYIQNIDAVISQFLKPWISGHFCITDP